MTDIDVPDWVVDAALTAYVNAWDVSVTTKERCETEWDDQEIEHARVGVKAALRAALSAWVVPAPALHISERCAACGDVLHASVSSDNHYTLRQEKPE